MILLLLLARLPRRPHLIFGYLITAVGLVATIAGLFTSTGLVIDGGIVLLCGLFLLFSLRIDPDRIRGRLAALRGR